MRSSYYQEIVRVKTHSKTKKTTDRFDKTTSPYPYQFEVGDVVFVKEFQISDKLKNWMARQNTKVRLKSDHETETPENPLQPETPAETQLFLYIPNVGSQRTTQ